jgi:hypothetical protein
MSSETELDLELQLLPSWAKQSPDKNPYAKYQGGGEERERRGGTRFGGPRPGGPRRDRPPGDRPARRPEGDRGGRPAGPRSDGPRGGGGRFGRPDRGPRGGDRRDFRREETREPAQPLPEVSVNLIPDDKGVESIAKQIKLTGRAYPLFDIAHLILQKPERYQVRFSTVKKPDGKVAQPLFICALDDTLWFSEAEATSHALRVHFKTFYQTERTPCDAPKGTFTFVAQCGVTNEILGAPNYHGYQSQLARFHAERLARMPFEAFKSRIKMVRDEAVVKKWVEDQSFKTEFICLNVPEPKKLASRDEVERHFRETHRANVVKPVQQHSLAGNVAQQSLSQPVRQLAREEWEEQQRFPIKLATVLSQQFASHGLQFFKVNKTVTHVSVARPHYLNLAATPVSDGIKQIVDFINATPRCTRRKLLDALAPSPALIPVPTPAPPAPAGEATATSTEGAPKPEAPGSVPVEIAPTPEQTTVNSDLHWLIHQGHVIEFANGVIETAKMPLPKPVKAPAPAKPVKLASKPADAATSAQPAEATAPQPESAPVEAAPIEVAPAASSVEAIPEAPAETGQTPNAS